MEILQSKTRSTEELLSFKDILHLYLSKWYWFVISMAVCLVVVLIKLKFTPPVFTRSTSIMIKRETKGNSAGDIGSSFSDMGFFQERTNIDNEMENFRSPNLIFDVVSRLNLNIEYTTEGRYYNPILYGDQLPVTVAFKSLSNQEVASLTVSPKSENEVYLSNFTRNGIEFSSKSIVAKIDAETKTPAGTIVVSRPKYKHYAKFTAPIMVNRYDMYGAAAAFAGNMKVEQTNEKATVIQLSVNDMNIQRAEEFLNTVINVYNENWIKDKNKRTTATSEFINQRLNVIENELGNVDNSITSFKSVNRIPSLSQAASMNMSQSAEETRHIMELTNQLNIARYLMNYIRGARMQLLPANAGLEEGNIQGLINNYNEMQLRRNHLAENSSEENFIVQDLDQQLASLRTTIINSIDNYIAALNMRISASQAARAQADAKVSDNPRQAGELLSSERQQKVKESLYLFLLQKREENELSQTFTAYNTRVITTPEFGGSNAPTAPNRQQWMLIALAVGFAIPLVLIYLIVGLNTAVRGRKDLEGMEVPFIGEIPEAAHRKGSKLNRLLIRLKLRQPKNDTKPRQLVVKPKSRNLINEAFRVVRTNIEFMLKKNTEGAQIIMVTSANPGSGKTFISANVGAVMAIKGNKTLIIDLDLRRKTLSSSFGKPKVGIVNYLSGATDDYRQYIMKYQHMDDSFDIIPVGALPPNPAELLSNGRLEKMLNELRSEYDYIFLDCPPIQIVADADIINRYADTTLFVIRAGMLDRSILPEIDMMYRTERYRNMCIALNGVHEGGRYGYKYGYRYGYSYTYGNGYGYGHHKGYGYEEDEKE